MEQTAAPEAGVLSRAAVIALVAGLIALCGPWLFPVETLWLGKTTLPGNLYLGSVTALVPAFVAIVTGHVAMRRTGPGRLRGRPIGLAGLAFGYVGLITTFAFELILWLIIVINPIGY